MRCLVTGASGFLGSRLVAMLRNEDHDVIALVRSASGRASRSMLRYVEGNFADFDRWPALLDGVSVLFHLAWSSIPTDAGASTSADAARNVVGTLKMLESIEASSSTKVLFASSGGTVYGQTQEVPTPETHPTVPISTYGASKLAVENYLRCFSRDKGIATAALRLSNVYGPGQSVGRQFGAVTTFTDAILRGEPITIFGDGETVRDYLYIDDVCRAMIKAGSQHTSFGEYNIGSGVGLSLNDLTSVIEQLVGRRAVTRHLSQRSFDVPRSILNIDRAKIDLDWRPLMTLQQGLLDTVHHLTANPGQR